MYNLYEQFASNLVDLIHPGNCSRFLEKMLLLEISSKPEASNFLGRQVAEAEVALDSPWAVRSLPELIAKIAEPRQYVGPQNSLQRHKVVRRNCFRCPPAKPSTSGIARQGVAMGWVD